MQNKGPMKQNRNPHHLRHRKTKQVCLAPIQNCSNRGKNSLRMIKSRKASVSFETCTQSSQRLEPRGKREREGWNFKMSPLCSNVPGDFKDCKERYKWTKEIRRQGEPSRMRCLLCCFACLIFIQRMRARERALMKTIHQRGIINHFQLSVH